MVRNKKFSNPWTDEELKIIEKYYNKGDGYLSRLIPNRSIASIITKRIRSGFLIGKESPLKGKQRGKIVKWTKKEIDILKRAGFK